LILTKTTDENYVTTTVSFSVVAGVVFLPAMIDRCVDHRYSQSM